MKIIKSRKKVRKELASEIVEILEEKLDEMEIEVPKKELVCEIADFISINKRAFSNGKAA